jgi:hypothetical protein
MVNAEVKAEGKRGKIRPKWAIANFELVFPLTLLPLLQQSAFSIQHY